MIETGARINAETTVPLGTEAIAGGMRMRLLVDGWLADRRADIQNLREYNDIEVRVVGTRQEPESLAQFKQRFRTMCAGQAYRAGVDLDAVHRSFTVMDIPEPSLTVGMWLHPLDRDYDGLMPRGTLMYAGFPDLWDTFGVFQWEYFGSEPTHLLGGRRRIVNGGLKVIAFPDGTEHGTWLPVTPEDEERIAMFKRDAWAVGVEAKRNNNYCGEFEFAMSRMGISAGQVADLEVAMGLPPTVPEVGVVCRTITEMDSAPVGTVIGTSMNEGATRYTKEADGRWGGHGVHHLTAAFNPPDSGWMYVTIPETPPAPEAPVDILAVTRDEATPVAAHDQMRALPVGTTIRNFNRGGGTPYTKQEDGQWHPNNIGNGYRESAFHLDTQDWRYVHIPVTPIGPALGDMITPTQCLALPEGAIVRHEGDAGRHCWMVRDNASPYTHTSATVNLFGGNGQHYSSSTARLLYIEGDMRIPVRDHAEMDRMPVGTILWSDMVEVSWTKGPDGLWDSSRTADFTLTDDDLFYTHIPRSNNSIAEEF